MNDAPIHLATVITSGGEEIRVSREIDHGRTRISVRVWFRAAGKWRPGQEGIALRPDAAAELGAALIAARNEMTESGR